MNDTQALIAAILLSGNYTASPAEVAAAVTTAWRILHEVKGRSNGNG